MDESRFEQADGLRDDLLSIWHAGVDAVRPDALIRGQLTFDPTGPAIVCRAAPAVMGRSDPSSEIRLPLTEKANVFVFGGGKAGAGMASALESVLLDGGLAPERLRGWVNVPDGFEQSPRCIHLHPARPLGQNEPTQAAVYGTQQMLDQLQRLQPQDVGICLISGGGSALLCAPAAGVTWQDKRATTRMLSSRGASIRELNCVRTQLSTVKGGGLARAFSGGALLTLVLSDVLGDPLETIASGPTVPQPRDHEAALEVLRRWDPSLATVPPAVASYLSQKHHQAVAPPPGPQWTHLLGNNELAAAAAAAHAAQLGYQVRTLPVDPDEGAVEETAGKLVDELDEMLARGDRQCVISGGEPVVTLVEASRRGLGGRNQQLVLTALLERLPRREAVRGRYGLLSGGTDGEDGPTDAAGAWFTDQQLRELRLDEAEIRSFQMRNDAYHFFASTWGLIQTGGTGTNVCDLRVLLTAPAAKID